MITVSAESASTASSRWSRSPTIGISSPIAGSARISSSRSNARLPYRRQRRSDSGSVSGFDRNRSSFSIGIYYAPYRNYSYRRFGIGSRLNSLFFGQRYWINDPWQYRLPEVYGPYRWVRYYDDVLLADVYSGEVVDVIYDFFW